MSGGFANILLMEQLSSGDLAKISFMKEWAAHLHELDHTCKEQSISLNRSNTSGIPQRTSGLRA